MQIGTATNTTYLDNGLTASTTYSYTVAAFDAAGNTSTPSASASATTAASGGPPYLNGGTGWSTMPNTQLQTSQGVNVTPALCPPNNYNNSGYPFSDQCAMVWRAWNSCALDDDVEVLYCMGGGHGDYSGDELYAVKYGQATPALVRLTNPMTPIATAANGFVPSDANCPQGATTPTCGPPSTHTYGGLEYDPQLKVLVDSFGYASPGGTVEDMWWLDTTHCSTPGDPCTWTRKDSCGTAADSAPCADPSWPTKFTDQPYDGFDPVTQQHYFYFPNKCAYYKFNPSAGAPQFTELDSGDCPLGTTRRWA